MTTRALSRQEVRSLDEIAIKRLGVFGVVLMENAGRGAADAIGRFWPELASAAVVAGSGNNGGDGYVVARHLAMRGVRVAVFLVSPREKVSGDADVNLRVLEALGQDIRGRAGSVGGLRRDLAEFDIVVDAVGGTGISGALRGDLAAAVDEMNAAGRPIAAIDIPTGLDCDTGQPAGPSVRAVLTITFAARKIGFDSPQASQYTGKVVVADIGIPADVFPD